MTKETNQNDGRERSYTLGELAGKTLREMRESDLVKTAKSIAAHIGETVGLPYAIPTIQRRVYEREECLSDILKMYIGMASGVATAIEVTHGDIRKLPKYLALAAGTNAASWVYEKIRKAKQNLKEREMSGGNG